MAAAAQLILMLVVALWPLVLIPMVLLLLVRPAGRLAFFALGLIFCFTVGSVMNLGGPDSPGLIIPFAGLCLSLAALLAELLVRAFRLVRRRGAEAAEH